MLYALTYIQDDSYYKVDGRPVIKVGFTDDFQQRINSHKYGYPLGDAADEGKTWYPIKVFATTDGGFEVEQYLHRILQPYRAFRREWYWDMPETRGKLEFLFSQSIQWDYTPYLEDDSGMADYWDIALTWLKDNLKAGQKIKKDAFLQKIDISDTDRKSICDGLKTSGLKRRKELSRNLVDLNIEIISKPGRYGSTFIYKHGKTTNTKSPQLPVF